jgi:Zinc dependent phospholipase C
MAGTFTHFVICNKARSKRSIIGGELWKLLSGNYRFMFLGSVSPDLPYLSFKEGKTNWADVMHYEWTNSALISGCEELKQNWAERQKADESKLAWLLGFASHLVIDATVHPVVKKIVGDYESHKEEHRACEMTQDSILFKKWMKQDIKYSEFSEILKYCREADEHDDVMKFWKKLLTKAYPEKEEEPDPKMWVKTYAKAIDFAEGDSGAAAIFRHAGTIKKLVYETSGEIIKNQPVKYTKYFTNILILTGGEGDFEKDVAERAVQNVTDVWKRIQESLTASTLIAEYVKNWNLDTGEDQDTPSKQITYWA